MSGKFIFLFIYYFLNCIGLVLHRFIYMPLCLIHFGLCICSILSDGAKVQMLQWLSCLVHRLVA